MESDFWRFYKIDLCKDGFSNTLTWRKFLIFIKGLPEDSAFYAFCRNKKNRNFVDTDEELIDSEIKRLK